MRKSPLVGLASVRYRSPTLDPPYLENPLCSACTVLCSSPHPLAQFPARRPRPERARLVWVEELTWMEVRDAMKAGEDSHHPNRRRRKNAPTWRRAQLCPEGDGRGYRSQAWQCSRADAPFVPEGFDPPTTHMPYPG